MALRKRWFPQPLLVIPTEHQIGDIALSPDGKMLILGYYDARHGQTVELREIKSGHVVQTLPGGRPVNAVAYSIDGKVLASGSGWGPCSAFPKGMPGEVRLWNLPDHPAEVWQQEKPSRVLRRNRKGWRYYVSAVAFSPDGKTIAAGGEYHQQNLDRTYPGDSWYQFDGVVSLWDVSTGKLKCTLSGFGEDSVNWLTFSPDGRTLAVGTYSEATLWDVATGRLRRALRPEGSYELCSIAFSPDGKKLATGGITERDAPQEAGALCLWDAQSGRLLWKATHGQRVGDVTFSSDGRLIIGDSGGGVGRDEWSQGVVWDAHTGQELQRYGALRSMVLTPDGTTLVDWSPYDVKLYDAGLLP